MMREWISIKKLENANYTHDQIKKMLLSNRKIAFRYEILDKFEKPIGDCTARGNVDFNSETEIMRVASLSINEIKDIDYVNERIKPYLRLWTPKGWSDYPLGVFLMSAPSRQSDGITITRECDCYDKALILREDKFLQRYIVRKNTNYVVAIKGIIESSGIYNNDIDPTVKILNTDIEFEIGTPKIEAINTLLKAINYNPLYFDEMGVAKSTDYVPPAMRFIEEEYKTDKDSIVRIGAEESLDIFNFPNVIVRYLESPEVGQLRSIYTNADPSSKLSTVSRGRTIVDVASVEDVADQATLDAYVRRLANEKQAFETVKFKTGLMPHHTYQNCLFVENKELGVTSKYVEVAWNMNLELGGEMNHICRKVAIM